ERAPGDVPSSGVGAGTSIEPSEAASRKPSGGGGRNVLFESQPIDIRAAETASTAPEKTMNNLGNPGFCRLFAMEGSRKHPNMGFPLLADRARSSWAAGRSRY